jgi:hypothetical protein
MAARRILVLLLLPWLGSSLWPWATGGVAAEPPVCTGDTAGTVACIGDRLCRCAFERAGSMTDPPAGHRWDCGVLRPYCHRPPTIGDPRDPFTELQLVVPGPESRRLQPPKGRPVPRPMAAPHR